MVTFFNKQPQFESISFGSPVKGSDNKYFISCSVKDGDSPGDEVLCQFSKQLVNASHIECGSGADLMLSHEETIEFIKECDEQMLNLCKVNKEKWFTGKDISDAYVDQAFMASMKDVKKQRNTYMLKVRTSKDFVMFDSAKNAIESAELPQNSKLSAIVQVAGLWFTATRFGITWMLRQGKVNEQEKSTKMGCSMFVDEDDEVLDANVFPDE